MVSAVFCRWPNRSDWLNALRHFLHIAGDIGKFDAEPANAIGELVDEALALGRRRGGLPVWVARS